MSCNDVYNRTFEHLRSMQIHCLIGHGKPCVISGSFNFVTSKNHLLRQQASHSRPVKYQQLLLQSVEYGANYICFFRVTASKKSPSIDMNTKPGSGAESIRRLIRCRRQYLAGPRTVSGRPTDSISDKQTPDLSDKMYKTEHLFLELYQSISIALPTKSDKRNKTCQTGVIITS